MIHRRHGRSTVSRIAAVTTLALAITGCTQLTRSNVSVDYYAIDGKSTAALDREIRRKGPRIADGRHAVAVARIRIQPNVRYSNGTGGCRVETAKVHVDARVTLPRFIGQHRASRQVNEAWNNIDRYTRLHEAVHVEIAFRFAKVMERELLALPPKRNCALAREAASATVGTLLKAHDKAQKAFDADEQKRFERLARGRRGNRGT